MRAEWSPIRQHAGALRNRLKRSQLLLQDHRHVADDRGHPCCTQPARVLPRVHSPSSGGGAPHSHTDKEKKKSGLTSWVASWLVCAHVSVSPHTMPRNNKKKTKGPRPGVPS